MDLISVESPEENTMVQNIVSKYKADGVWTSGRLCNFHGCEVNLLLFSTHTLNIISGPSLATQEYKWVVLVRIRLIHLINLSWISS